MVYSLFSMSCGPIYHGQVIDPAFRPLFTKFLDEGASRGANIKRHHLDNLVIVFDDLSYSFSEVGAGVIGYCTWVKGAPLIHIDRMFWAESDSWTKEELLFHELGHCVLFRGHVDALTLDGRPMSIMYPFVIHADLFNQYTESDYLDELFTRY